MENSISKVYECINKVQIALSQEGISKNKKNTQQNYSFRGIDDIYNVASGVVAKNNLSILPRVLNREVQERATKSGGVMFYVTVYVEFDIVCSLDGSKHTVSMYGEAMDSADKATNKAMSAAEKYMCLMTFMLPTEGDNDADSTTPEEVIPKKNPQASVMKKQDSIDYAKKIIACKTVDEVRSLYKSMPKADQIAHETACKDRASEIQDLEREFLKDFNKEAA